MINQQFFQNLLWIIVLVVLQSFVFNNIGFQNVAYPFIYIIFLLRYPLNANRYGYLLWAFILGLGVDFFDNTLGIHSFSSVFIAFIRPLVVQIFKKKYLSEDEGYTLKDMAFWQILIYAFTLIFIHHLVIFCFDNLSFDNIRLLFLKTLYSSILSTVFVVILFLLFNRKRE